MISTIAVSVMLLCTFAALLAFGFTINTLTSSRPVTWSAGVSVSFTKKEVQNEVQKRAPGALFRAVAGYLVG